MDEIHNFRRKVTEPEQLVKAINILYRDLSRFEDKGKFKIDKKIVFQVKESDVLKMLGRISKYSDKKIQSKKEVDLIFDEVRERFSTDLDYYMVSIIREVFEKMMHPK